MENIISRASRPFAGNDAGSRRSPALVAGVAWLALFLIALASSGSLAAETITLLATADIWLSDAGEFDRNTSAGLHGRFKLKSVQEMAAIRFDASSLRGRRIRSARLEIRHWKSAPQRIIDTARRGWGSQTPPPIRFLRVSTIGSRWEEGAARDPYSDADGATWRYADHGSRRPWSWTGSTFADVIMGAGNTLTASGEVEDLGDGWLSLEIPTELVSALVCGASDGLAVMEGGTPALENHFFHSAQSVGNEPRLVVESPAATIDDGSAISDGRRETGAGNDIAVGGGQATPDPPRLSGAPSPEEAHLSSGALRLRIGADARTFCHTVEVEGVALPRWRVPWPRPDGTELVLDDLPPSETHRLTVTTLSPEGLVSPPATIELEASEAKPPPPDLPRVTPRVSVLEPSRLPRVWALPAWAKPSPFTGQVAGDSGAGTSGTNEPRRANGIWDGQRVRLAGVRGEYLSFQLCIDAGAPTLREREAGTSGASSSAGTVRILLPPPARDDGARFGEEDAELWRCWYARNRAEAWQPAYLIPARIGDEFPLFHPDRGLPDQRFQSLVVDLYVPPSAPAGSYDTELAIILEKSPGGTAETIATLPVEIRVHDATMPDRLSFWVELNAYRLPEPLLDYHRLAHQNRLVFNPWVVEAPLAGHGPDTRIRWPDYDGVVAPLLDGSAFAANRRANVPVECMYLPFYDSWPTELDPTNYDYPVEWPVKGDDRERVIEHYERGPLIELGLSTGYTSAFRAAQAQFIEHFAERGWDRTEMQCFFGSKAFHRIRYRRNVWWTTDEPVHWSDWRALAFFDRMWSDLLTGNERQRWVARADVSRPEWQIGALGDAAQVVYYGGMDNPTDFHRMREIGEQLGVRARIYGEANGDDRSNLESQAWILRAYLEGAQGVLPWQSLGGPKALELNDRGAFGGGNALLVDGRGLGVNVVGDLRLRALRDGQQLVELLELVAEAHGLDREQLAALVGAQLDLGVSGTGTERPENVEAIQFEGLGFADVEALRLGLLELLETSP